MLLVGMMRVDPIGPCLTHPGYGRGYTCDRSSLHIHLCNPAALSVQQTRITAPVKVVLAFVIIVVVSISSQLTVRFE